MPLRAGKADSGIIAHDLCADHGQGLGLGRIDLARHDRGPRLVFRQDQLTQARARARAEQTHIIGDLEQRDRHSLERTREHDHRIMGRQRLELVGGWHERQAGNLGDLCRHAAVPADARVQAGSYCRAALCQFVDFGQNLVNPQYSLADLMGISAEFLPQRQGGGILGMGAADLDDVLELHRLVDQGGMQLCQTGQQDIACHHADGHMHRRRKGVVGTLAHVHVVIGVNRFFRSHHPAQHFNRAVRDHLVRVHVGLRA